MVTMPGRFVLVVLCFVAISAGFAQVIDTSYKIYRLCKRTNPNVPHGTSFPKPPGILGSILRGFIQMCVASMCMHEVTGAKRDVHTAKSPRRVSCALCSHRNRCNKNLKRPTHSRLNGRHRNSPSCGSLPRFPPPEPPLIGGRTAGRGMCVASPMTHYL